jgi:sirohydrochlorin ferrochelatase
LALLLLTVPAGRAAATDGVLLLAHGGRAEWNGRVDTLAAALNADRPVGVAFGMASRPALQSSIDRLIARGVSRIVAVPLFISSHSSVITSTEYLLGLREEMPADLEMFATHGHGTAGSSAAGHGHGAKADAKENLTPVRSNVPIVMTKPLNAHPILGEILLSRARSISRDAAREAVILVAHGPVSDDDNERWLADMRTLATQIAEGGAFSSVDPLTVRDDAPPVVRDAATAELRDLVRRKASEGRRVLVVPLLLTFGGIEQGIRKRLDGLEYTMAEQGLLPDDRIERWVRLSIAQF